MYFCVQVFFYVFCPHPNITLALKNICTSYFLSRDHLCFISMKLFGLHFVSEILVGGQAETLALLPFHIGAKNMDSGPHFQEVQKQKLPHLTTGECCNKQNVFRLKTIPVKA